MRNYYCPQKIYKRGNHEAVFLKLNSVEKFVSLTYQLKMKQKDLLFALILFLRLFIEGQSIPGGPEKNSVDVVIEVQSNIPVFFKVDCNYYQPLNLIGKNNRVGENRGVVHDLNDMQNTIFGAPCMLYLVQIILTSLCVFQSLSYFSLKLETSTPSQFSR